MNRSSSSANRASSGAAAAASAGVVAAAVVMCDSLITATFHSCATAAVLKRNLIDVWPRRRCDGKRSDTSAVFLTCATCALAKLYVRCCARSRLRGELLFFLELGVSA